MRQPKVSDPMQYFDGIHKSPSLALVTRAHPNGTINALVYYDFKWIDRVALPVKGLSHTLDDRPHVAWPDLTFIIPIGRPATEKDWPTICGQPLNRQDNSGLTGMANPQYSSYNVSGNALSNIRDQLKPATVLSASVGMGSLGLYDLSKSGRDAVNTAIADHNARSVLAAGQHREATLDRKIAEAQAAIGDAHLMADLTPAQRLNASTQAKIAKLEYLVIEMLQIITEDSKHA